MTILGLLLETASKRVNISLGGVAKLSNKFTNRGTMNYAKSDVRTPPIASSRGNGTDGLSVYGNVFFTPLSVDLMGLPFENPIDGSSVYFADKTTVLLIQDDSEERNASSDYKPFLLELVC